jgi:hypothetical protein
VQAISTSYNQKQLYLKDDGTLWLLAKNATSGQLDGTSSQVASGVVSAGAGLDYYTYLKTDGTLWGVGGDGWAIQFGDGTTPVQIADHVVSVSANGWYLLYVKNDQTLWGQGTAWSGLTPGSNYGNPVSTPIQLLTGVTSASANLHQILYITTDGTLWTRGNGFNDSAGPAVPVDTGVLFATSAGSQIFESLYLKADGILRSRTGIQGTLGPIVQVAPNVVSVSGSADEGSGAFVYFQTAGSGSAPSIDTPPQSAVAAAGAALTLQVAASGTGPLNYQWSKDGVPVSWARTAQYPIPYATAADVGSYTVTVTNSAGQITSAAATVSIAASLTAQTITFNTLSDVAFTTMPIPLTATSDSSLTVTFTVDSGPAMVTGNSLTLTGTGTVTVRASQAGNATYSAATDVVRSFNVTASFASWQQANFSGAELSNSAVSGPNAVYGQDGLSNLVKYALGLNPKQNITTGLPVVGTAGGNWVYTYTRPTSITDVTYSVEISTNLTTWTSTGVTLSQQSTDGTTDTWTATYPLASATNVFFRLKVVQ